jgi:hypothetical protein
MRCRNSQNHSGSNPAFGPAGIMICAYREKAFRQRLGIALFPFRHNPAQLLARAYKPDDLRRYASVPPAQQGDVGARRVP